MLAIGTEQFVDCWNHSMQSKPLLRLPLVCPSPPPHTHARTLTHTHTHTHKLQNLDFCGKLTIAYMAPWHFLQQLCYISILLHIAMYVQELLGLTSSSTAINYNNYNHYIMNYSLVFIILYYYTLLHYLKMYLTPLMKVCQWWL